MKIKPQHQDTIVNQYLETVKQVNYHNEVILVNWDNLESWEIKEYNEVNKINLQKIENFKEVMIENESVFNEILFEYGLSVVTFISKYQVK